MHFTLSLFEWGLKIIFLKTYKRNVEGKKIEEKREKCFFFVVYNAQQKRFLWIGVKFMCRWNLSNFFGLEMSFGFFCFH
jgi:hypothetical protein